MAERGRKSRACCIPPLPDCPGHDIWKRDFLGSSGLFSIILKPASPKQVAALLDSLELFGLGYSWGGFWSLVIPFDCSSLPHRDEMGAGRTGVAFLGRSRKHRDLQADLERSFAAMKSA